VIEHHLDAYGLRDTVTHNQGSYSAIIADTITRYRRANRSSTTPGRPTGSAACWCRQGRVWLQVPFSALPGVRAAMDTALPDGSNYGFQANDQRIVANLNSPSQPRGGKLFEMMRCPPTTSVRRTCACATAKSRRADIERHADAWIRANRETFDGWIAQALAAAE
jgi:glycine betaine/proline transport system substrate-binding protein